LTRNAAATLVANPTKRLNGKLEARILSEFDGDVRALRLCRQFAAIVSPEHPALSCHIRNLIGTARGESGEAWAVRRLAALLLERQAATAIRNGTDSADSLLVALGLKDPGAQHVHGWLLEEGFTSSDVKGFLTQLLLKIQRRKESLLDRRNLSLRDWEDLFHRAKQECRLVLKVSYDSSRRGWADGFASRCVRGRAR